MFIIMYFNFFHYIYVSATASLFLNLRRGESTISVFHSKLFPFLSQRNNIQRITGFILLFTIHLSFFLTFHLSEKHPTKMNPSSNHLK